MGNITADIKPLTKEEEASLRNLVSLVSAPGKSENEIANIVIEEAGAYFSGDKGLDEVTKNIQNRATTYIQESK